MVLLSANGSDFRAFLFFITRTRGDLTKYM